LNKFHIVADSEYPKIILEKLEKINKIKLCMNRKNQSKLGVSFELEWEKCGKPRNPN